MAALYGVFAGGHSLGEFVGVFFIPTILGNILGGVALVAAINYAQVAYSDSDRDDS